MFFSKKDVVEKMKELSDLDRERDEIASLLVAEREEFLAWKVGVERTISFASNEKDYLGTVIFSKLGEGSPYHEKYKTRLIGKQAQIAELSQHLAERTQVFEKLESKISCRLSKVTKHRDHIAQRMRKEGNRRHHPR